MLEYEFDLRRQRDGSFWIRCRHLAGLKWLPVFLSPKTEKQFREWLGNARKLLHPEIAEALHRQAFEGASARPIRFRCRTAEMSHLGCRIPGRFAL